MYGGEIVHADPCRTCVGHGLAHYKYFQKRELFAYILRLILWVYFHSNFRSGSVKRIFSVRVLRVLIDRSKSSKVIDFGRTPIPPAYHSIWPSNNKHTGATMLY